MALMIKEGESQRTKDESEHYGAPVVMPNYQQPHSSDAQNEVNNNACCMVCMESLISKTSPERKNNITSATSILEGRKGRGLFGTKKARWYSCIVKKDNKDGTIRVQWNQDGTYTSRLPLEKFQAFSNHVTMTCCNRQFCHDCAVAWIQQCERNGFDQATCPYCRQLISFCICNEILGRSYERVSQAPQIRSTTTNDDDDGGELTAAAMDDFTQTWLENNSAQECPNCGLWMVRDEATDEVASSGDDDDDDDEQRNEQNEEYKVTACMCGHIYCWTCNDDAEDCGCDHDEVYCFLTDQTYSMSYIRDIRVANAEDLEDFADFMERRKSWLYGDMDDDDY